MDNIQTISPINQNVLRAANAKARNAYNEIEAIKAAIQQEIKNNLPEVKIIGWEGFRGFPFCIWCSNERNAERPILAAGDHTHSGDTYCTACGWKLATIVERERNMTRYDEKVSSKYAVRMAELETIIEEAKSDGATNV